MYWSKGVIVCILAPSVHFFTVSPPKKALASAALAPSTSSCAGGTSSLVWKEQLSDFVLTYLTPTYHILEMILIVDVGDDNFQRWRIGRINGSGVLGLVGGQSDNTRKRTLRCRKGKLTLTLISALVQAVFINPV